MPRRWKAQADPGAEQEQQPAPIQVSSARLAVGQGVDDAAEQNGFHEQRGGKREVGDGQNPAEARLGPKHSEHAHIKADKFHSNPPGGRMLCPRLRMVAVKPRPPKEVIGQHCGNAVGCPWWALTPFASKNLGPYVKSLIQRRERKPGTESGLRHREVRTPRRRAEAKASEKPDTGDSEARKGAKDDTKKEDTKAKAAKAEAEDAEGAGIDTDKYEITGADKAGKAEADAKEIEATGEVDKEIEALGEEEGEDIDDLNADIARAAASEDIREGAAAWAAKRPPKFTGR